MQKRCDDIEKQNQVLESLEAALKADRNERAKMQAELDRLRAELRDRPVVTVDAPAPPQVVHHVDRIQTVETPSREDEAWDYAIRQLTRKYPGSEGTAEFLVSLKNQYLKEVGKR